MTATFPVYPHPTHDIKCERCKHWGQHHRMRACPMPNGQWAPFGQLMETGQYDSRTMPVRDIAACTHGPGLWPLVDSEHWCGQYEGSSPY